MSCLQGIVNLRGCNIIDIPGAVYSLNSLPGISLQAFEQIANSEQLNYLGVWRDINERAEARIMNKIRSELSKRYTLIRVKRTVDISGDTTTETPENAQKGLVINCNWFNSNNWQLSPFQTLSVDRIRFYKDAATTALTVGINFFDWETKEILYTKTLTFSELSNGWNTIQINKEFQTSALAIGFNSNDITTVAYDSNPLNMMWGNFCNSYFDCGGECGEILGFSGNNTQDNIIGIQAVVTIGCSYNAAICNNKLLFAEAYWYYLGAEFMSERISSSRCNFLTTVKKDEAKELQAQYTVDADLFLTNALDGLRFECDSCLDCNGLVSFFSQTP